MPRRNRRPRRPRRPAPKDTSTPTARGPKYPNAHALAQSLVTRGLADRIILGPVKPRPTKTEEPQ